MPLNDSFNQQGASTAVTPMALAKMSAVPSVEDLAFALSVAQKNQHNIVELPWKSSNNPNNYIIKVTCSESSEEPTWFLHLGGDEDQPVLWNYETSDATLIHSLVTAECERTTYTAPLEQEQGNFPSEVELNLATAPTGQYLPREHEQPLPTAPVKPGFDTSLEWNDQSAPGSGAAGIGSNSFGNPWSPSTTTPQTAPRPFDQQKNNPLDPAPPNNFGQPVAAMAPPAVAPYTDFMQQPQQSLSSPHQASAIPMTNSEPSRQSVATAPRPLPAPIDLDRAAVDSIYKSFTNPDTGFVSHAAFLFFLVNEFNRYQKDPKPLSVVRFDLCVKPVNAESTITPMPSKTLQEAGRRIFSIMRPLDWAAHYEQEFAILMPFTGRAEAGQLAHRIATALLQSPLVPGLDPKMLGISMGVSSMPEDCTHPGILLAAAQDAKNRARKAGVPVMLFSDGI